MFVFESTLAGVLAVAYPALFAFWWYLEANTDFSLIDSAEEFYSDS